MTADALHPEIFLSSAFKDLPQGARPWVAGFRADPYHPKAHWGGAPVNGRIPDFIEPEANCYLAVSSFKAGADGRIHRRKDNFAALHLVMVDDVGTKVSPGAIALDPSYLLETSPGNHQAGYLLSAPVTDRALAESVIDALVAQGLATGGLDPGMKGVTRYGRLPIGINNKPALVAEHGQPFPVQMREWEPERRYTLQEIIAAYGLKLGKPGAAGPAYEPYTAPADDSLLDWLAQRGQVQGSTKDSGWIPISCPWVDEHTDRADTGAAYLPGRGFQCHHGHCESRTLLDLRAWAKRHGWICPETAHGAEVAAALLKQRNEPDSAPGAGADEVQSWRLCDMGLLRSASLKPPAFLIHPLIPRGHVTLFGGHGGSGKTSVGLALAAHVAAGQDWAGLAVSPGRVLFLSFEDGADLVLWRLRNVVEEYGMDCAAVETGLALIDATDAMPLMSEMNQAGIRKAVITNSDLLSHIAQQQYDLVIIDNASDAFDGDENNRRQVRLFVRNLAKTVSAHNGAILLLAHIDKSAARYGASGNSYSGSTGWHNSARSRLALVDNELRQEKLNVGKVLDTPISLFWTDRGVPVPDDGAGAATVKAVLQNQDEKDVLAAFRAATEAGAVVSAANDGPSTTWHALSLYPELPKHLRENKARFRETIARLIRVGKVRREEYLNAGRKRKERLILAIPD